LGLLGSGCGTLDRVVAPYTKDPQFESDMVFIFVVTIQAQN